MELQEPGRFLGCDGVARLAQDGIGHEAAAHADATVDRPHGELDANAGHRLMPGKDVLVDAVHKRSVQVEQKGGTPGGQ
jgi:hypothetical protein